MFLLSEMFKKEKVSFLSRVASENVCVMGTCSYVDYPLWWPLKKGAIRNYFFLPITFILLPILAFGFVCFFILFLKAFKTILPEPAYDINCMIDSENSCFGSVNRPLAHTSVLEVRLWTAIPLQQIDTSSIYGNSAMPEMWSIFQLRGDQTSSAAATAQLPHTLE